VKSKNADKFCAKSQEMCKIDKHTTDNGNTGAVISCAQQEGNADK
jgi:hypothetical protein